MRPGPGIASFEISLMARNDVVSQVSRPILNARVPVDNAVFQLEDEVVDLALRPDQNSIQLACGFSGFRASAHCSFQ